MIKLIYTYNWMNYFMLRKLKYTLKRLNPKKCQTYFGIVCLPCLLNQESWLFLQSIIKKCHSEYFIILYADADWINDYITFYKVWIHSYRLCVGGRVYGYFWIYFWYDGHHSPHMFLLLYYDYQEMYSFIANARRVSMLQVAIFT